jgi:hypothetical protein
MFQRSGSGIRRAVVMAALVAGVGVMAAAGGAAAADKGHGPDKYVATAQNCPVVEDWSSYRKCGDTGSGHEPQSEARHVHEPTTPTDNEPAGVAAAQND